MNLTPQTDPLTLPPEQGDRLIRLFQDSFDSRSTPSVSESATSPAQHWQPTLTDLTGRVVHALDPLLVEQQSPEQMPTLRWQPDASATNSQPAGLTPIQSSTPVSEPSIATRPAAKPTL